MRLMTAHKILIASGCAFFLLFGSLQWWWIPGGRGTPLAAALGFGAAGVLAVYFWTLRGK